MLKLPSCTEAREKIDVLFTCHFIILLLDFPSCNPPKRDWQEHNGEFEMPECAKIYLRHSRPFSESGWYLSTDMHQLILTLSKLNKSDLVNIFKMMLLLVHWCYTADAAPA